VISNDVLAKVYPVLSFESFIKQSLLKVGTNIIINPNKKQMKQAKVNYYTVLVCHLYLFNYDLLWVKKTASIFPYNRHAHLHCHFWVH